MRPRDEPESACPSRTPALFFQARKEGSPARQRGSDAKALSLSRWLVGESFSLSLDARQAGWPAFAGHDTRCARGEFAYRRCLRTTSFTPHQVSVTAQTLTSTRSVLRATLRISSSVTSVGIFADFCTRRSQIAPSEPIAARALGKSRFRARSNTTNRYTRSQSDLGWRAANAAPSGSGPSHLT